ncbi:MAG: hypothetical protein V1736_00140 [Pseudomonadota bacterium]
MRNERRVAGCTGKTKQTIDFQIKLLGALSVGDVRTGTIPSLLPSQKHYLKVYILSASGERFARQNLRVGYAAICGHNP